MVRPRTIDRETVLDAAEAVIVQYGARELSFDALATAAGITKGGVQSCFGTKENLISAMLQRWGDAHEQAKRELLALLATEGAFMLHYLGLAPFGDAEWADIFRDIGRCAGNGQEVGCASSTVGNDRSGR